jgi:outer membrane protein assembly factor BamB
LIWDLLLTAWLYSELEERNGILYFGTAGQGGHFYGVSLIDGRVIFDWNTGGTTAIIWINNYLAITDRNGDLVLLNPTDGSEVKRFHSKSKVISANGLEYGGKFYTSMSDKKEFHKLYAVCLELP